MYKWIVATSKDLASDQCPNLSPHLHIPFLRARISIHKYTWALINNYFTHVERSKNKAVPHQDKLQACVYTPRHLNEVPQVCCMSSSKYLLLSFMVPVLPHIFLHVLPPHFIQLLSLNLSSMTLSSVFLLISLPLPVPCPSSNSPNCLFLAPHAFLRAGSLL